MTTLITGGESPTPNLRTRARGRAAVYARPNVEI